MKFSIATAILSVFTSLVSLQVHAGTNDIQGRLTCVDRQNANSVCWQLGVEFNGSKSACEVSAVISNGKCSQAVIRVVETTGLLKGQAIFEQEIYCAYSGTNPNHQFPLIGFAKNEIRGSYGAQYIQTHKGEVSLEGGNKSVPCVVE